MRKVSTWLRCTAKPPETVTMNRSDQLNQPDAPLSHEAEQLLLGLRAEINERLDEAGRKPACILLWGPDPTKRSAMGDLRISLRRILREEGHLACFSEELLDGDRKDPVRLQQLAQAQSVDLIVSLPSSPGAIGELHDFAADRRVNAKILAFIDRRHLGGYGPQSLESISTLASCTIEYYSDTENRDQIVDTVLFEAQRIREMKYILDGRPSL